jgi:predicted nucleic acid-binding Zn ribbon protein
LSKIEEDGKKWLRRPKFCTKCCRAVLRRRRRRRRRCKREMITLPGAVLTLFLGKGEFILWRS